MIKIEEKVLLRSSGGLLLSQTKRWYMGEWIATNQSLSFSKEKITLWSCPYKKITDLNVEEMPFSFGKKQTICLECKQKPPLVWLIVANLEIWKNFICNHAFHHPLTEEQVCQVAQEIDAVSEEIVWCLWEKGCATLDELKAIVKTDEPMDILKKIKEIINPASEKLFGFPLCVFKTECRHPLTKKISKNHWWLYSPDSA